MKEDGHFIYCGDCDSDFDLGNEMFDCCPSCHSDNLHFVFICGNCGESTKDDDLDEDDDFPACPRCNMLFDK